MPRPIRNQFPLNLPPEPDAAALPRYITAHQCEQTHFRWWGPAGARTIREAWPLTWHVINGRAVVNSREFFDEATRRFDAAPVVQGGARDKLRAASVEQHATA